MNFMEENTKFIYVNCPEKKSNFQTITEALQYISKDYLQKEPTYPATFDPISHVTIYIGAGIYREKIVVERPNITFVGDATNPPTLVYNDYANDIMEDGSKRGTFRTASFRIHCQDISFENLIFQNDAGYGYKVGQALALYIDGDRIAFHNCTLLGSQDTLFTAPLPQKEAQPNGFLGPGQNTPRILGRHYFKNCTISGDVDFIFGGGIAYFEKCTIFSVKPKEKPSESPKNETIYGYITAASTPESEEFGYVFKNCHLLSDCPPHSVYLGRPWREYAKTVFLNCYLGDHIHPLGWHDWNKTHGHFYYGEYHSYGPGASPYTRADFSHQLTDIEAEKYTIQKIFKDWTLPFNSM